MANDARGGSSADAALVRHGAVIGSTQEGTVAGTRPSAGTHEGREQTLRLGEDLDGPVPVGSWRGTDDTAHAPVGTLDTVLLSRGWVKDVLDWQWWADGAVHARVLTAPDGACLVLGQAFPGDWSGHLAGTTLLERLADVEAHRTGRALPVWAVTDSLLADVGFVAGRTRSWWHSWDVVRDEHHGLTLTTRTGPLAARRPTITFTPRPAREVARSPQAVRLQLDGHPSRWFWARRLLSLANMLQGHQEPAVDLCDVTDHVEDAWELHHVLDEREGWFFTGTCHGRWQRGHPLRPVVTVTLTRTPGEVLVELCGTEPGVVASTSRVAMDELPSRLDEVESHRPGRAAPAWPSATVPTWQCLLA